jgi:hypothetical protein
MSSLSIWEALAGRAPGRPLGPAEPGLYDAVIERLNPARARPRLLSGIDEAPLLSVRGAPYVMLRSPGESPAYLRLDPAEVELAHLMDGSQTVASLVGAFARLTGKLAPTQVLRVVADLAANRMLEELPVDAFRPVRAIGHRGRWKRAGGVVAAILRGRRYTAFGVDRPISVLYRLAGWVLFTRVGGAALLLVAAVGGIAFVARWVSGEQSIFLVADSHAVGAAVLLALNAVCLAAHELGHALAAKHAGRRVPAAGVMLYFGIPSVFVDTSDVWMAGRRARLLTSAAGPLAALVLAGAVNLVALAVPELSPIAFKLAFLWYLNVVFNLNPLLALDGYYLLMDWLELPNLRGRGLALTISRLRRRRLGWAGLTGENRLYAMYGTVAVGWLVVTLGLGVRLWKDRLDGLGASLWHEGLGGRVGLLLILGLLFAPVLGSVTGRVALSMLRWWTDHGPSSAATDQRRRFDALARTALATFGAQFLGDVAARAAWLRPPSGAVVPLPAGAAVVAGGVMEAVGRNDPPGVVRERALTGDVIRSDAVEQDRIAGWRATDARLLVLPPDVQLPDVDGAVATPAPRPQSFERRRGAHGDETPVLAWPAGADAPPDDGSADRRLGRRFLWLLGLVGAAAIVAGIVAIPPGSLWAEISTGRVLVSVERGTATVSRADGTWTLEAGDRIALRYGDRLAVGTDSLAGLAFRDGLTAKVCPESAVAVGAPDEEPASQRGGSAVIELADGHVIFVPGSRSAAVGDLAVFVRAAGSPDVLRIGASGAHVTLADGSVKFIADHVDTWIGACDGGGGPGPTLAGSDGGVGPSSPAPSGATAKPSGHGAPGPSLAPTPVVAESAAPSAFPASTASASPATPGAATTSPTPKPTATPAPTPAANPTATAAPTPAATPTPTPTPSFSIACAPTALEADPGESARSTCTVTSIAGFASAVSLACTGISGIGTCAFAGSPVTPPAGGSAWSELTVAVDRDAKPGCYSFTVVATSGSQTERVRMRLDVPAAGKPSCT